MLVVDNLHKRLGRRDVLRGAALELRASEIVWLRGVNGCGKSTLIKCIAGVWRPDRGDIRLADRSLVSDPAARCGVGYVPDRFAPFPELTVAEMLALVAALKRSPLPAAPPFDVDDFAHQPLASLSAGQTRRAALLAGLIGDPWLLVLDEPTTGLDADGLAALTATLLARRAAGQATVLVTHEPAFAATLSPQTYTMTDGLVHAAP